MDNHGAPSRASRTSEGMISSQPRTNVPSAGAFRPFPRLERSVVPWQGMDRHSRVRNVP
jgi:hypothetical protein